MCSGLKAYQFYLLHRQMEFTGDRFQADCEIPVNARRVVSSVTLTVLPFYSSDMDSI